MSTDTRAPGGAFAPPTGPAVGTPPRPVPSAAQPPPPVQPPPVPTPAAPRRNRTVLLVVAVAVVGLVAALALVITLRGGGSPSEPLLGRYEGSGGDMTIAFTVSGDPPAISELHLSERCGNVSNSQRIEFGNPMTIEGGRFELMLPPPGATDLKGSFTDGGARASGSLSLGDCSGGWEATHVAGSEAGLAPGAPAANQVTWRTEGVTLTASNFYVVANDLVFTAPDPELDGDSGRDGDTTLEVRWVEHEREMKLEIDFETVDDHWWAEEIEIYDGTPAEDSVYFEAGYFRTPIGETFRTDRFEVTGPRGEIIRFDDLSISTGLTERSESDDDAESAETIPAPTVAPAEPIEEAVEPVDEAVETVDDTDETVGPAPSEPFTDEFDGVLADGWTWANEDPSRWSLDTTPGSLDIVADDVEPTKNLLLRPAPPGDFVMITWVRFEPTANFQFAGLTVIGADPDDFLRAGRAFCDSVAVCVGDGFYFDRIEDGELVGSNFATPIESAGEVMLVMEVIDGFATVYADDGSEFVAIGPHPVPSQPTSIGLVADNSPVDLVASFDVFETFPLDETG